MNLSFCQMLRSDVKRLSSRRPTLLLMLKLVLTNSQFSAVAIYRTSHVASRRAPALGRLWARTNYVLHGVDIDPRARIGPGLLLQHPAGVVIGADVEIGRGATLMSGVVLGRRNVLSGPDKGSYPTIGDDVLLSTHAVLLGPITVGHGSTIGAHALVLTDVPPTSVFVGVPARAVAEY